MPWCPCWTVLTSKVSLWGYSFTTLVGEVGGWMGKTFLCFRLCGFGLGLFLIFFFFFGQSRTLSPRLELQWHDLDSLQPLPPGSNKLPTSPPK